MPKNLIFVPMKHSSNVYAKYVDTIIQACRIRKPQLSALQLLELENAIKQGGKPFQTKSIDASSAHQLLMAFSRQEVAEGLVGSLACVEKFKYSDTHYNVQAAMFDFAYLLFQHLSKNQYNRLIVQILVIDKARIDNTFLRNNALVKYLLIIQMSHGVQDGRFCEYTLTHFNWIRTQVPSSDNFLEIINFSLIKTLNNLSDNFKNCKGMLKIELWNEKDIDALSLPQLYDDELGTLSGGAVKLKQKPVPLLKLNSLFKDSSQAETDRYKKESAGFR